MIMGYSSGRYEVQISYGFAHRGGIRINDSDPWKNVAESTMNRYVRDVRAYASGHADHINDVTNGSTGERLITAYHWVNGFENVRQLRIRKLF
ncbi:hypothetical protein SEA_Phreeze_43 [Mycobacterium phage Phreeze]|uniref:Uncharacterized protein n=1 Tax=Mycobacterium phage Konstantine TaxID=563121 RepID=B5U518_9CAUD|nr:gp48 [Mycobacterium phage Konstantine]ACI12464.1 hypothetical protein KONSTANTINE_48 [Mycobacterium phage Konstantine]QDH84907.1 hypothetical protein SEA_Phreeze_43 [Mycobacterium phage Phreeze]